MGAGDSTGLTVFVLVGWIFGWAIFAVAAVALTALVLARPSALLQAVLLVAGLLGVVAAMLWRLLLGSKR